MSKIQAALNVNVYEPEGEGREVRTLLFAHGYGCDQRVWRGVAASMTEHRRVLFDWPGAGASDVRGYDSTRHASLDGYADDLLSLMESLGLRDTLLVGHSVAASIAALAASRDPSRFGSVAMVAPSPCFMNDLPRYRGGFERADLEGLLERLSDGHASWSHGMAPVIMGNPERPELASELAESFCRMDPTIALRWARATFLADIRAVIPKLNLPCLVMSCEDDALAPAEVGIWLAENLQRGQLVRLRARGHCPHVSAPLEVAETLSRVIATPRERPEVIRES